MNSEKPQVIKERVASQMKDLENAYWISCLNCLHFEGINKPICKLVDKQPPLKVMIAACEQWKDVIPF